MAKKNILIKKRNGTTWDELYPITTANNIKTSDGSSLEAHLAEKASTTSLGHVKQGQRIIIDTQGVISLSTFDIPLKTTANVTYYVNPTTGNDYNNGMSSTSPLKTIQAAINRLPQVINHMVTINIAPGTYNENIIVNGLIGQGTLYLKGDDKLTDTYIINSINVSRCGIDVYTEGVKALSQSTHAFHAYFCKYIFFKNCKCIEPAPEYDGFHMEASNSLIVNSEVSNKRIGISSKIMSAIESSNNSGENNTYGLLAQNTSTIGKDGTQPGGITAEATYEGGVIR